MNVNKTVAVFLTHKDDVQQGWLADAAVVAQRHGITLFDNWAEQPAVQVREISEWVWKRDCDALVVLAITDTGLTTLLCDAVSRGRSVILLNRTASDMDGNVPWSWPCLRQSHPRALVATTVPNAIETGRVQGRQFKALLPEGGDVLYVVGDPHSSDGRDRLKGIEEVISTDSSFRMSKAIGGFRETVAEEACVRWLRIALMKSYFQLDLVGSQSEVMVPGIRRAFQQAAKEHGRADLAEVPITAVDGLQRYKEEVDQGRLAATVELPSRVAAAIDLLLGYWNGRARPAVPIILLPVVSYPSLQTLSRRGARGTS